MLFPCRFRTRISTASSATRMRPPLRSTSLQGGSVLPWRSRVRITLTLTAFWMARRARCTCARTACVASSIATYAAIRSDLDLRRKAYSAVAAKLARIVYGLTKLGTDYRPFFEEAIPGG
jgi:hypothetical protein